MVEIEIQCSHCKHKFVIDRKAAQSPIQCLKCGKSFRIRLKKRKNLQAANDEPKLETTAAESMPKASAEMTTEKTVEPEAANAPIAKSLPSESDIMAQMPMKLSSSQSSIELPEESELPKNPQPASKSAITGPAANKARKMLPPKFSVSESVAEKAVEQINDARAAGFDLGINTQLTRIEHGGQKVEVRSMSRDEKQRRKSLRVAILYSLSVAILIGLFLYLLNK